MGGGGGSFEPVFHNLPPFRAPVTGTPNRLRGEVGGGVLRYPNTYEGASGAPTDWVSDQNQSLRTVRIPLNHLRFMASQLAPRPWAEPIQLGWGGEGSPWQPPKGQVQFVSRVCVG